MFTVLTLNGCGMNAFIIIYFIKAIGLFWIVCLRWLGVIKIQSTWRVYVCDNCVNYCDILHGDFYLSQPMSYWWKSNLFFAGQVLDITDEQFEQGTSRTWTIIGSDNGLMPTNADLL